MAKDNIFENITSAVTSPIGGAIRGAARGLFPGAARAADIEAETFQIEKQSIQRQQDMEQLQNMLSIMKYPNTKPEEKKAAGDTARRILIKYHPEWGNRGQGSLFEEGTGAFGAMGDLGKGDYELSSYGIDTETGQLRTPRFKKKDQYPEGYQDDLDIALKGIKKGNDPFSVFYWISGKYPERSSELGRILLAEQPRTFMDAMYMGEAKDLLPQKQKFEPPVRKTPLMPLAEEADKWLEEGLPEQKPTIETVKPKGRIGYKIPIDLRDIFLKLNTRQKSAVLQIGGLWETLNEQEKKDVESAIRQNPQNAFEILKRLKGGK